MDISTEILLRTERLNPGRRRNRPLEPGDGDGAADEHVAVAHEHFSAGLIEDDLAVG